MTPEEYIWKINIKKKLNILSQQKQKEHERKLRNGTSIRDLTIFQSSKSFFKLKQI